MNNRCENLIRFQKRFALAMHPIFETIAKIDFTNHAQLMLDSIRPLVENQKFYTAQIRAMKLVSSAMINAIPPTLLNENVQRTIYAVQGIFSEAMKNYDISSVKSSLSQLSYVLDSLRNDFNYDFIFTDEQEQDEFDSDLLDIINDDDEQRQREKFNDKFIKWLKRNPSFAIILRLVVLPLMLMMLYDVTKFFLIKPPQAAIREQPDTKSEIITQIEQQELVIVIDSRSYWVNVIYLCPENGLLEGWITTRSCVEMNYEIDDTEEFENHEKTSDSVDTEENDDIDNTEELIDG